MHWCGCRSGDIHVCLSLMTVNWWLSKQFDSNGLSCVLRGWQQFRTRNRVGTRDRFDTPLFSRRLAPLIFRKWSINKTPTLIVDGWESGQCCWRLQCINFHEISNMFCTKKKNSPASYTSRSVCLWRVFVSFSETWLLHGINYSVALDFFHFLNVVRWFACF